MSKARDALKMERLAKLPPLTCINDLTEWIATRFPCEDAPADYKPPDGWHSIRVGNAVPGSELHSSTLHIWARLFNQHALKRTGTLYWRTAPYYDRESRTLVAQFCIDRRQ